jgi:hypothetical protein
VRIFSWTRLLLCPSQGGRVADAAYRTTYASGMAYPLGARMTAKSASGSPKVLRVALT